MLPANRLPLLYPVLALGIAAACTGKVVPPAASAAPTESTPLVLEYPAEAVARRPLTTVAVARRVLQPRFVAPARIAFDAEATVHVGIPVHGRVRELPVKVGTRVGVGDVLAVVESQELGEAQNELLLQRRTAAVAAPLADLAREAWESARRLLEESQGVSLAEVRRRESEYREAESRVLLAQAAAEAASNRLLVMGMAAPELEALVQTGRVNTLHSVRSPAAGTVVERNVFLGDFVDPDHEPLFTVVDTEVLWVLAEVPESRVGGVTPGSEARVRVAHAPELQCTGTVAFVAPTVDLATHTARVRIELRNAPASLRPGMYCESEFVSGSSAEELVVPESALQWLDRKPVVFVPVAGEPTRFHQRQVEVGTVAEGLVAVRAGLAEGDLVVTDGSFLLKAHAAVSAPAEGN